MDVDDGDLATRRVKAKVLGSGTIDFKCLIFVYILDYFLVQLLLWRGINWNKGFRGLDILRQN